MASEELTDLQEKASDFYKLLFWQDMDVDTLQRIELFEIDNQEALEENAHMFSAGEFDAIELAINPK